MLYNTIYKRGAAAFGWPSPFVDSLLVECWQQRQGEAMQAARQDQLSRAKAKQARQPSQISRPKSRPSGPFMRVPRKAASGGFFPGKNGDS